MKHTRWQRKRPRTRFGRVLTARYLDYTEWLGYLFVILTLGGVVLACFWPVEDTVEASSIPLVYDSKTDELRFVATFRGETIERAQVGSKVIISGIVPDNPSNTLLRADLRQGGQVQRVTARRLLDSVTTDALRKSLIGQAVKPDVKSDETFAITEVEDLEVSAQLAVKPTSLDGSLADFPDSLRLRGDVISGDHQISLQVAELLKPLRERVAATLIGKTILPSDSAGMAAGPLTISSAENIRLLAKVRGTLTPNLSASGALLGVGAERRFEATVRLHKPTAFLKEQVKRLAAEGRSLKVNAIIQTGTRPLAWRLLKK